MKKFAYILSLLAMLSLCAFIVAPEQILNLVSKESIAPLATIAAVLLIGGIGGFSVFCLWAAKNKNTPPF